MFAASVSVSLDSLTLLDEAINGRMGVSGSSGSPVFRRINRLCGSGDRQMPQTTTLTLQSQTEQYMREKRTTGGGAWVFHHDSGGWNAEQNWKVVFPNLLS